MTLNRLFRGWRRFAGALLLALATGVYAQSTVVEVITLRYRTAEQVMPVLRPLLDKAGTMTGMQNQLILRTTPSNLADLRKVLDSIDAMPRRLMITVRQDAGVERERSEAQAGGRVVMGSTTGSVGGDAARGAGGSVEVRSGNDVLRGRVDSTRSLREDRNVQSVQVLEGNSAFIAVGQSVPVQQIIAAPVLINGSVVNPVGANTQYRDTQSGFYVLPRTSGDRVVLEISPQLESFAAPAQNLPQGSVNMQRAATTVAGRLGEWIEIGGVAQGANSRQDVILGSTRDLSSGNRRILVKVDEVR